MEIQLDLISEDCLSSMTSMEKIRFILDSVRSGNILVLERGLTPEEEMKLIEVTMAEIGGDFMGIEIESYPIKQRSLFGRFLGKPQTRLTVIGPAKQMKTIKKNRDFISALISLKSFSK
ncbi:MAG: DUF2073 domain-containing protein [Candidatus Syntropharchaeia archaeon]